MLFLLTHFALLLTKYYYKNFIKNVKAARNRDTNFYLIHPYLWYNWYVKTLFPQKGGWACTWVDF